MLKAVPHIAFIDGLHYYEFVLNDLLLSYDLLKPGAFLFLMTMSAVLMMFQIGQRLKIEIMS